MAETKITPIKLQKVAKKDLTDLNAQIKIISDKLVTEKDSHLKRIGYLLQHALRRIDDLKLE